MIATYLLAIPPSSSVADVVLGLKTQLGNRIKFYPARNSRPHITILSVLMDDSLEPKLLSSLQSVITQEHPISMTTSDIGYFVPNQTVYVAIREHYLFSKLSRNISRNSIISDFPSKYKCSTYVPHITVGRNLKYNFDFARNYFKEYSYEETFTATSALLMKKYNGGRYVSVQEFPFCAIPSGQLPIFTSPIYV